MTDTHPVPQVILIKMDGFRGRQMHAGAGNLAVHVDLRAGVVAICR